MTDDEDHSDDIALAGEYVLHLLDAEERRAFEARLAAEPDLRALVRDWDEGLVALADNVAEVEPPRPIKARIDSTLFGAPARARPRLWHWLSGAVAAAALVVAVYLDAPLFNPSHSPSLTAEIAAEDRSIVVVAQFVAETGALLIDRRAGAAPAGRVLELWLIAEGAAAPVSLGVLPEDTQTQIALPEPLAAQVAGGTLAISDEPPGGSPTGAPTGAVLALGAIEEV